METRRGLTVSSELRKRIDDQARRDYPSETCGFLMGHLTPEECRVLRILEALNRNIENPLRLYEIDRAAYESAEAAAVASGLHLIGIYHSHPDSPPLPSQTDAVFAFPDWIYWITPVENGVPGDPRIWHRTWNPEGWHEWDCVVVNDSG
jgi:proteasome lid subunit RPN8/RPN11